MNWKVIFGLSMFGVAMGIGTVFVISPRFEPFFWLVIFVVSAFVIARQAPSRPFLHGFLLGIVNSVWVTAAHVIFFERYLASHAQEEETIRELHAGGVVPRVVMAVMGPAVGLISGAVMGVLAYAVAKALKSRGQGASTKARRARAG
jgi:Na+/serine symporter